MNVSVETLAIQFTPADGIENEIGGMNLADITAGSQPKISRLSFRYALVVKRTFDLFCVTLSLPITIPLALVLMLIVMSDGGGPFFAQTRVGRNGRRFRCLKFRSMIPDAEEAIKEILRNDPVARAEWEKDFKLKQDPRVTRVGRFLRSSSLDELPQLWNIIVGEMSLVGPRPIVEQELGFYAKQVGYYYACIPGLTGLWQVSGRNDTTYDERVALDVQYAKNWSFWGDVGILLRTIPAVLRRDGAY